MVTQVAKTSPSCKYDSYDRIAETPVYSNLNVPLAPKVRAFVEEAARLCRPDDIYICDGSDAENKQLLKSLESKGTIQPLTKYENW